MILRYHKYNILKLQFESVFFKWIFQDIKGSASDNDVVCCWSKNNGCIFHEL